MEKTTVAIADAPQAVGPYSQGIVVRKLTSLAYFSGQIAIDPTSGKLHGQTATEQAEQIVKNIDALLRSQNMTAENVVKTTVFLTDINAFAAVNTVYAAYFGASLPARSCVAVAALPLGALVEIEITAAT